MGVLGRFLTGRYPLAHTFWLGAATPQALVLGIALVVNWRLTDLFAAVGTTPVMIGVKIVSYIAAAVAFVALVAVIASASRWPGSRILRMLAVVGALLIVVWTGWRAERSYQREIVTLAEAFEQYLAADDRMSYADGKLLVRDDISAKSGTLDEWIEVYRGYGAVLCDGLHVAVAEGALAAIVFTVSDGSEQRTLEFDCRRRP